jgi:SAM-dependent methyltransferase
LKCRHCHAALKLTLLDLGTAPPSNAYLSFAALQSPERWFPLRVLVCERCWLVQTEDFADANELFDAQYAYFSSFSSSWLAHAERYVGEMISRFELDRNAHVVEIAANDGYLLQFVKARGIPCTGVEPTASTAAAARAKGIDIIEEFFGTELATRLAARGLQADLIAANNVLAHVPDINDFAAGIRILLKPDGVASFEFPQLAKLMAQNQFDTVYHEHFSYLSLTSVKRIFESQGLAVFDVAELDTHGGSLRVFTQRAEVMAHNACPAVDVLLGREASVGTETSGYYSGFQVRTEKIKDDFVAFLIDAKRRGFSVGAYGAAAKGNTLSNFAGVKSDLIAFVADRNPAKIGRFLPGSRIPIVTEEHIRQIKPHYLVIFPWNLKNEIMAQLEYVRAWGGKFVIAVPTLEIWP